MHLQNCCGNNRVVPVFCPHNAYYSIVRAVSGPQNHYSLGAAQEKKYKKEKTLNEQKEGLESLMIMPNNSARL